MEWITFAIWFGCGYLCKITKDFMWEQRMKKIFERMSDTEKRAIATQAQWPNVFKLKESKDGPRLAPSRVWSSFLQRPTPKAN